MSSDSWLTELLAPFAAEIRGRGLIVRCELDSGFQLARAPHLEAAFEGLFRFVFSTLPDGCEFYLASSRTTASVAPLGSGTLTLRWQVAGEARHSTPGGVRSIRPIAGGAVFHAGSSSALALEQAFDDADWTLDFEATNEDGELWVRAGTR
jgi:hypothetical protein